MKKKAVRVVTIQVRMTKGMADAINKEAERLETSRSSYVRMILRGHLSGKKNVKQ